MQNLFDSLYSSSLNGNNFYKLTKLMRSTNNIRLAYRNIKRNKGSLTPGIDGKCIEDIEKLSIDEVVSKINRMFDYYKPGKVKRVFIPKSNGDLRPLGIPTIWDRLFQQCILQILEPICEAKFHPHSYGFRPNRNAHHAIARANHLMNNKGNGYHYCVDMDIKGFFDNVDHGKLLKQLWNIGIREKKLLSIISALLKAEIDGEGIPLRGTPQGSIISPLLANVVLNELDWWVSNQWETFKSRKSYASNNGMRRNLKRNTNLKECFLVRYCDDFKIYCRNYATALKMFHATKDFLKTRLNLAISPEKSKIVNLRKHKSEFLGFYLKVVRKGNKYVAYSHMSDKALKKAKDNLDSAIKNIAKLQSRESVWKYNTVVMGIQNYYEVATHISKDLGKLSHPVTIALYNRVRRDWKVADKKTDLKGALYQRYKNYNPKFYKAHDMIIIPIYAWKHKYAIQFNPKICSYTKEGRAYIHDEQHKISEAKLEEIRNTTSNSHSIEFWDNCITKFISQNGKCFFFKEDISLDNSKCVYIEHLSKGIDRYKNIIFVSNDFIKLCSQSKRVFNSTLASLKLNPRKTEIAYKTRKFILSTNSN